MQHNTFEIHPYFCMYASFVFFCFCFWMVFPQQLELFLVWGSWEWSYHEHSFRNFSVDMCTHFSWKYAYNCWVTGSICLILLETTKYFSTETITFYTPTSSVWSFNCPNPGTLYCHSSHVSHSGGCMLVSPYNFSFQFPDDQWYWTYFHVLMGHSYIFSHEVPIQEFCPF